jgi:superfamily I DNA and/or RNA helicase
MNESQDNNTTLQALENLRMRLLDLTARNRLINFKHTKRGSLRIIDELPDQLTEALLSENEMNFLPVPEPTLEELVAAGYIKIDEVTGQEIRLLKDPTAEEWAKRQGLATSYEVPTPSTKEIDGRHSDTAIQTLLYPYELEVRLKNLMQTSESAIQEMGANILYLAFGYLEWFESSNDNPRIAPLFLVPARLKKGWLNPQTKTYEYRVSYSGEDIIPNLSLREKLRADFAMALPDLDENTTPEEYFKDVLELIQKNQSRWRLRRFITLTLLNFSKLLMYLDLDPSRWPEGESIVEHSMVKRFLAGYNSEQSKEEESHEDLGFGEEYPIDEIDNVHTNYPLIDDADSSQHSALIDAVDGKNLVIEGPPGTGKSQTITNLIAAAMAQGKRVLFVAEKLAALEVVRRRLDNAGLGEFCLELHSHKSQKRRVLDEVEVRLDKHQHYRKPRDIETDIARYEELKTVLKEHVERINRPWKNTSMTLHDIFMAATRYRKAIDINPNILHPEDYNGDNFDVVTQRRTEDQVEAFRKVYQAIARQLDGDLELQQHPWFGVRNGDLQMFDLDRVKLTLEEWQNSLQSLNEMRAKLREGFGCGDDKIADSLNTLSLLLDDLERVLPLKGDELLDRVPTLRGEILDSTKHYLELFDDIQSLYATLGKDVEPDVLQELSLVDGFLAGSEHLCSLVGQTVDLGTLAEAINLLTELQDQLSELAEPLQEIHVAVGDAAASHLLATEAGLTEFNAFIGLVARLNPSHWKLRDELFDNDELDEMLPEIRDELNQLHDLRKEWQEMFDGLTAQNQWLQFKISFDEKSSHLLLEKANRIDKLLPELKSELEHLHSLCIALQDLLVIDRLPCADELQELGKILDASGSFRWFRSSWRTARKQLLSYAVNSKIKFSVLHQLLEKVIEFSVRKEQVNNNSQYKEAFGDHMQSLDTDIATIESLRDFIQNTGHKVAEFATRKEQFTNNQRYKEALGKYFTGLDTDLIELESLRGWYKQVRKEYGVGFGQRVTLGNAILDLPLEISRAVRSLFEQGVQKQLIALLDDLYSLKEIFSPVSALKSKKTILIGEEGAITRLLRSLNEALLACKPLVTDNAISIAELAKQIKLLDSLNKAVYEWEVADVDRKFFQSRLGLRFGIDVDNSSSLSMLRNTLEVATCVDQRLINDEIRQRIYNQPEASTFNTLVDLSGQLRRTMETQKVKYKTFEEVVTLDPSDWMKQSDDQLDKLITRNSRALNNSETLQNWLDYVRVRDQVTEIGLFRLATAVEHGDIDILQVDVAYKAGIFDALAREILREQPELGRFSGHTQEALRDKFSEYDNRLKKLQCEKIAWHIDQVKIPSGNFGARVSEKTERCLLEHEYSKKSRHIPIRQLLHRASGALVAIKPCFMMGPMSVAQYLAPGQLYFDLVIMDEASQIKPQDALGAVARGSQLVVVGDPKQLPPTSFFERVVDDDEEDPTAIEESESILDATRPMFQARQLRWHYRSQHEKLIEFSNHSFYDGNLVLFPSPYKENDSYGIKYSRVPRGSFVNRRNMEEAKIISEAVREHFRHQPVESLGVVAMSAEQRLQIESAIEMLAKEDNVFQELIEVDSHKDEPLFIKNLENVQGDERDIIFISMTYGPQEPGGKVYQRFGPINSEVGWRRLNVLFTRAKKRMHIFSSMRSTDILTGSTSKRGVHALHDFLAFCETGILHKTERDTGRAPDSDFEIAVMESLHSEGFKCVPQLGVTGFFIDIAVVDPGNQGRYLMGIECDGATYHSAKSTRDRDRLRQAILERLGWRIRRIWSTDWFKNPEAELKPIIRELHELKTERLVEASSVSESDEIEGIIEDVEKSEASIDNYITEEINLRDKLLAFDREVMRKELPEIPDNKRLLRPAILDALLEHLPTDKSEFLEVIPLYLRESTATGQGKYLDNVLELINLELERMTK